LKIRRASCPDGNIETACSDSWAGSGSQGGASLGLEEETRPFEDRLTSAFQREGSAGKAGLASSA